MRSKFRALTLLLSVILCFTILSVPALAFSDEDSETEPVSEPTPQPLTPEGNMTLVDDIDGEAAEDKQFITVVTKSGNYFYIIVDRAEDGENTVHFLNQVDEADLMALMESEEQAPAVCSCTDKCAAGAVNTGCEICAVNMAECAGKEPEPTPEPEPDPEPDPPTKKGMGSAPLLIVPVLALGGGAVYWLKFKKPKPDTKGSADLDDYDYGEDDDEDEDYETEGEDE